MTETKLAELTAQLAAMRQRIMRDRDHARQIVDPKVREEVELYIKELERVAEALATEIAILHAAAETESEQYIAALKPPTEPDTDA